ncbi:MgtC/SapB family protein [Dyella sp.]|uniref:MgtC/SapB family protein n=1 Tax=Dyella sp. TaxID=1869338 RepID=UPI003F7FC990
MTPWTGFAVALGIGLLMGAERERRKGTDAQQTVAGIRTFSVVALFGAICAALDPWLVVAAMLALTVLVGIAYARDRSGDPGLTTEASLLGCLALGALATRHPLLAAGVGVAITALLASREWLHRFVRGVLTTAELNNLLVLAAATLMVLPLIPDRAIGPFDAIHPRTIWIIVILVMAIGALAHVLLRWLGSSVGLPLAGLLSGFVSSTATIGVMGSRARGAPAQRPRAVAAAVLSTVATFAQMAAVLAVTHAPTLRVLAVPLLAGGIAAAAVGAVVVWRSRDGAPGADIEAGAAAFSVKSALLLGATIALVQLVAAALQAWLGQRGLLVAASVAGFADTHAPAVSFASLAADGAIAPHQAMWPILLALTTNTVSKAVVAVLGGGRAFAQPVIVGLALVLACTWAGALLV